MTASKALPIIADLAEGSDPVTGQTLPSASPYFHPEVVAALHLAARALEREEQREEREQTLPAQAGRPWSRAQDDQLCAAFDEQKSVAELARLYNRTTGAIRSRLAKLGKMTPPHSSR